jgi:hypothetical protein
VRKSAADEEKDDTVPSISPLPVLLIESISDNVTMTAPRPTILCRIAHNSTHSLAIDCRGVYPRCLRTEQFRPAIRSGCAHYDS